MELLRTERVILRAWREDEADRLLDILSRPEVKRWIDDDQENPVLMATREEAVERIRRYAAGHETGSPRGFWAVEERATGVVAGTVLITAAGSDPPPDETEVEIGWHLHPDAWGHGYASEAARVILRRGFEGGLEEIHAVTHLTNDPSQAVCRRIGMEHRGVTDRWYDDPSEHFVATRAVWSRDHGFVLD